MRGKREQATGNRQQDLILMLSDYQLVILSGLLSLLALMQDVSFTYLLLVFPKFEANLTPEIKKIY